MRDLAEQMKGKGNTFVVKGKGNTFVVKGKGNTFVVKGKGNTFVVGSVLGPLLGAPLAAHFVGAGQQLGGRELVQAGHDGALLGRGLVARRQGSFGPVPRVPPKLLRGLACHVV